jgi:hypothetical protein
MKPSNVAARYPVRSSEAADERISTRHSEVKISDVGHELGAGKASRFPLL